MTATAMTEDEMVRSLMRDYDVSRDRAVAMVAASRGAEPRMYNVPGLVVDVVDVPVTRRVVPLPPKQSESDMQIELLERLVGPAVKGLARASGAGLAATYPELALVYAINPNAGAISKRNAGRSKAMGLLADMPDLHLPVMRGPFLTLYVELKRPGESMTPAQRTKAAQLREQGHAVVEVHSVEEGVRTFTEYLHIPLNRPAARAVSGKNAPFTGTLAERIEKWRAQLHLVLQPERRK